MTKFLKALWARITGSRAPQRVAESTTSSYAVVHVPRRTAVVATAAEMAAFEAAVAERARTDAQKARSRLDRLTAATNRRLDGLAPSYMRWTGPKHVTSSPRVVVDANAIECPVTGPVVAARCAAGARHQSADLLVEMLAALATDEDPVRVLYRFANVARNRIVKDDPRLAESLAIRARSAYAERKHGQVKFRVAPTGLVEEIIL